MHFANSKVIITGGSGGIGRLLAARFIGEGARLAVMSRRDPGLAGAVHWRTDLSTCDGIGAARAIVTQSEPDILVNLAGVQYFGPVENQSHDALCTGYMINLVAPVALCQAALPAMKRRNAGQIVNVGSMLGSIPLAHFAAYSSAKAGLRAFSEALRRELAGSKIAVTHIAPRAVRTPLINANIRRYAEATGMTIDDPEPVVCKIFDAITRRRKDLNIGMPEALFARINAVFPRLVDAAVAGADRKSKALFL